MGQASSAQREPSMEEILASIRKIIEETDGSRKAEGYDEPAVLDDDGGIEMVGAPLVDAFDETPATGSAADAPGGAAGDGELGAFRAAMQGSAGTAGPAKAESHDRPFSLSDVQRRLMRDRTFDNRPREEARPQTPEVSEPEADSARRVAEPEAVTETPRSIVESVPAEKVLEDVQPAVPAAAPERRAEQVAHEAPKPAIISPAAGRQVAGAFEELKEAFMASRQRSFDEMAEDMMRPMLQDWLDNNLPLLVERLVREEIERVARGG